MALPTTLTGFASASDGLGYSGPFISSTGNVYVVGYDTTNAKVAVWKATDPTASFTVFDSTLGGATPIAYSAVQVSNVLHVAVHLAAGGSPQYLTFNMATDTWGSTVSFGAAPSPVNGGIALAKRSTGSDVIVFYNTTGVTVMGKTYARIAARRIAGGTTVGAETTISLAPTSTTATAQTVNSVVLGASDRVHLFYSFNATGGAAGYIQAGHRTVKSSDNLDGTQPATAAESVPGQFFNTYTANDIGNVLGLRGDSDGTHIILAGGGYDTTNNRANIIEFTDADSLTGGTSTAVESAGTALLQNAVGGTTKLARLAGAVYDGTNKYVVWQQTDLSHYWDGGASFGTDNNFTSGGGSTDAIDSISVYQRGTSVVLAILCNKSGPTTYDEVVLRAVSGTKALAAKAATASSAKASVRAARPIASKAATASNMKASLRTARPFAAKMSTANSAKTTSLSKLKSFATKMAIASGMKETSFARAARLQAKVPTADSAKALRLNRQQRFSVKLATASSTKENLRATRSDRATQISTASSMKAAALRRGRPVAAKMATAVSMKASMRLVHGLTTKMPTAQSSKATVLNRNRSLLVKMPQATNAKAMRLNRARPLTAKFPTASGSKATMLQRMRAMVVKFPTASNAKAITLDKGAVKSFIAKFQISFSTKASARRAVPVAAKLPTASKATATARRTAPMVVKFSTADSAKQTMLNRSRPLAAKLATTSSAKATKLNRAQRFAAKLATASSTKVAVRAARRIAAKLPTATSAKGALTASAPHVVQFAAKFPIAAGIKAALRRTAPVAVKISTSDSGKATVQRNRGFAAKMPTANSAKNLMLRRSRAVATQWPVTANMNATNVAVLKALATSMAATSGMRLSLTRHPSVIVPGLVIYADLIAGVSVTAIPPDVVAAVVEGLAVQYVPADVEVG